MAFELPMVTVCEHGHWQGGCYDCYCDNEVQGDLFYKDFPDDSNCYDAEAQADLAYHDELFPDGYFG